MLGLLYPPFIYFIVLLLYAVVPARHVSGYVQGTDGQPLRYRLNGLRVFAITLLLYFAACHFGLLAWDAFYLARWYILGSAFVIGVLFTFAIVLPAPPVPKVNFLSQLYLGRYENPQFWNGRLDAKMYLYLAGAIMLELNILSFAAHHWLLYGKAASPGVALYVFLFSFFITEYLNFEEVHLYTYDFVAERVGFKLGWGCLVFYPFFYCVGLWSEAARPNPGTPAWQLIIFGMLFFGGWSLARGANMQKFYFKTQPQRAFLGIVPEALEGNGRRVLVNGFWGLSRHVNYLGELLMASALALSLGRPSEVWPWLYPFYYLALLLPRQIDDDRRCAHKYGPLWKRYVERVPYRIVPFVY